MINLNQDFVKLVFGQINILLIKFLLSKLIKG
jgi:hypothetical protein